MEALYGERMWQLGIIYKWSRLAHCSIPIILMWITLYWGPNIAGSMYPKYYSKYLCINIHNWYILNNHKSTQSKCSELVCLSMFADAISQKWVNAFAPDHLPPSTVQQTSTATILLDHVADTWPNCLDHILEGPSFKGKVFISLLSWFWMEIYAGN